MGEDQHGSSAQQPHSQLHQLAGWQALLPVQSCPLLPACRRLPEAAGMHPGLSLLLPLLPLGLVPPVLQLLAGEWCATGNSSRWVLLPPPLLLARPSRRIAGGSGGRVLPRSSSGLNSVVLLLKELTGRLALLRPPDQPLSVDGGGQDRR